MRAPRILKKRIVETIASKVQLDRRLFFVIGLTIMLIVPLSSVAEVISYSSVAGTEVQLISISRRSPGSSPSPYIAFEVLFRVFTRGPFLSTRLHGLEFSLSVDSTYISTATPADAIIKPDDQLNYSLEFQTNDPRAAATLGGKNSNYIALVMTTVASAGLYRQRITRGDSTMWTWSG